MALVFALLVVGCGGTKPRADEGTRGSTARTEPGVPAPSSHSTAQRAEPVESGAKPNGETLPIDPNNVYGSFDNGMKYILRRNNQPEHRVALYLHIKSGALNETSAQNGLAHFLEHMAFNGTTHYPPGQLNEYLKTLGLQFGADTNAHTTANETVYKLHMPDNSEASIRAALQVFADYAYGMLLESDEIDSERPIILNEKGTHKGVGMRLGEALRNNLFAGTRLAEHDVIGTDEVVRTAPRSEFKDYYDTWYRPKNTTLIVVGDVDADSVIAMARELFDSRHYVARADARPARDSGLRSIDRQRAFVLTDPELPFGQVLMLALRPGSGPIRTYEQFRARLFGQFATMILNRRMNDRIRENAARFREVSLTANMGYSHDVDTPGGSVGGIPDQWAGMLEDFIAGIKQGVDHGITQHELDLVKTERLAQARAYIDRESGRENGAILNWLASSITADAPILSAQQQLELTERAANETTVDAINESLRAIFDTRAYSYVVLLPDRADLPAPSPEAVMAIVDKAWSVETKAIEEAAEASSILAEVPTPKTPIRTEFDEGFQITTLHFENGAVVRHRYLDVKKGQASVRLTIAGGAIEEGEDNRGLSQAANLIQATSRLKASEIRDLMTGKSVGVGGGFDLDSYKMSIAGQTSDLEAGMQLAYAYMTDGRIEDTTFDQWRETQLEQLKTRESLVQYQFATAEAAAFYNNDVRFQPLSAEQIRNIDPRRAEAWQRRVFGRAPIEVAIVGDISLDDATRLASTYIATLPAAKQGFDVLDAVRQLDRSGPYAKTVEFQTQTPQALVMAGFQGADQSDTVKRRGLSLAAMVLTERMIKVIREEKGLVYSVGCSAIPARSIPGTGKFVIQCPAEPANAEPLADVAIQMMRDFAKDGPTEEELTVAKKQISKNIEKVLERPSYWLDFLCEMSYRKNTLEQLRTLASSYQAYTVEQLRDIVRQYTVDDHMIRVLAKPRAMQD